MHTPEFRFFFEGPDGSRYNASGRDDGEASARVRRSFGVEPSDLTLVLSVPVGPDGLQWAQKVGAPSRAVYIVHEGGDTPRQTLCSQCVEATSDPEATRRDIVARDDTLHCFGCDYHLSAGEDRCEAWQPAADDVSIEVEFAAIPSPLTGHFDAADLYAAVVATCHELFPNDATGYPVVPSVRRIDQ